MYPLIRQYLRRVDAPYLALCVLCSALSVVDVALAFGVSTSKVTEWIEEGRLEAANLNAGTPKKAFWKIPRASAVALARHINQGI